MAMVEGYAPLRSYNSKLRHAVNEMSRKVLGRPLDDNLRTPGKCTGELIGVEYLYDQKGNDPQLSVAELPAPQRQRTVPSTPERSRPSSASSARTTIYSPPRPSSRSVSRLNTSWVLLFFTFAGGVLASVMRVVDT